MTQVFTVESLSMAESAKNFVDTGSIIADSLSSILTSTLTPSLSSSSSSSLSTAAMMINNDQNENFTKNMNNDDNTIELFESISDFTIQNIIYSILYSTVSLAAIGGNGIVIYLIVNFRRNRRSVTDLFILNLAIGDLLMAILCIPFTFTANLLFHAWPFGSLMCRLVSYAQAVFVFISAYTLVAISIDRYIAIIYPLRPRMTKRHSQYLVLFVWIVALLTPLPTALLSRLMLQSSSTSNIDHNNNIMVVDIDQTNVSHSLSSSSSPISFCQEDWNNNQEYRTSYSVLLMILQYILPFTVLVFTYTRIGLMIWGRQTPGERDGGRDARIAASKRKMVKMMITCVVAFTLCWLPLNIFIIIGDHYPDIYQYDHIEYVWVACHWLAMSHASYNPFIYIWMNQRFRNGFRFVLQRCFCRYRCCPRSLSINNNNGGGGGGRNDGGGGGCGQGVTSNTLNNIHNNNRHNIDGDLATTIGIGGGGAGNGNNNCGCSIGGISADNSNHQITLNNNSNQQQTTIIITDNDNDNSLMKNCQNNGNYHCKKHYRKASQQQQKSQTTTTTTTMKNKRSFSMTVAVNYFNPQLFNRYSCNNNHNNHNHKSKIYNGRLKKNDQLLKMEQQQQQQQSLSSPSSSSLLLLSLKNINDKQYQ
uniref:RYamide receptor-like n=1 Tax=Dermatophagoides pteronyssinus TaxID=6956 RepID=A0A6P6XN26_DERPT|nr:RYamide receptor-like [Dermatophagoides pteronyssinus]